MLRRVHGLVRATEELVELPIRGLCARETDRCGRAMLRAVRQRVLRFGDRATNALRRDACARLRSVRESDDEFLAAPTRDEIALARDVGEDARNALENRVAGVVTERVVHLLEEVDVEEQHADREE